MTHLPHTTTAEERHALLTGHLASGLDVTEDRHDCTHVEYDGGVLLLVCPEKRGERPDWLDPRFAVVVGGLPVWTGESVRECVEILIKEIEHD